MAEHSDVVRQAYGSPDALACEMRGPHENKIHVGKLLCQFGKEPRPLLRIEATEKGNQRARALWCFAAFKFDDVRQEENFTRLYIVGVRDFGSQTRGGCRKNDRSPNQTRSTNDLAE